MDHDRDRSPAAGRTAGYLDLIRQLVTGDHEAYRRRCARLDRTGWEGLGLVVAAAFYRAVHGRFGGAAAPADAGADIIGFVADARTQLRGTGFDIDPVIAESAVRAALTGSANPVADVEPPILVQTELLLLWRMLVALHGRELTIFLDESGSLAERWRAEAAAGGAAAT